MAAGAALTPDPLTGVGKAGLAGMMGAMGARRKAPRPVASWWCSTIRMPEVTHALSGGMVPDRADAAGAAAGPAAGAGARAGDMAVRRAERRQRLPIGGDRGMAGRGVRRGGGPAAPAGGTLGRGAQGGPVRDRDRGGRLLRPPAGLGAGLVDRRPAPAAGGGRDQPVR